MKKEKMKKRNQVMFGVFLITMLSLQVLSVFAQRPRPEPKEVGITLNKIAESYVKLVLAVGQHDADYVDAYYGPKAWADAARAEKKPLATIREEASSLIQAVQSVQVPPRNELVQLRRQYLLKQLQALSTRVQMLEGVHFTFDQESRALYDAVAPTYAEAHFQKVLDQLEPLLPPGSEPLVERYDKFRRDFIIPKEKLDPVFNAAIEEARRRTKTHLTLPADESFTVQYVKDKSWSGYNWYQGGSRSLIQINTDLPIYIDRAVDLAAHEGYPGHHVYNALLEQHLVKEKGFIEFSVYPLFSPQSLIAEGSANFGIEVAFPGQERVEFERKVLFPLAGIDPRKADEYYKVQALAAELSYAGNEAARQYLDGKITADEAAHWLMKYGLMTEDRARQRVKFIDKYRSYVINYNFGQDLVKEYIERKGGGSTHPEKRWQEFAALLSSPRLPSGLR
jgi:hypothetical protein